MPRGWGQGPVNSRRNAARDGSALCPQCSAPFATACNISLSLSPRCAGPFPFATGRLMLLSSALARWYASSDHVQQAVQGALNSRLNRSGTASQPLPLTAARQRGLFVRPRVADDLQTRLFEDILLGHEICFGSLRKLTLLAFPAGVIEDVPCNGHGRWGSSGCRHALSTKFNWSSSAGLPFVLHNVKMASELAFAASLVGAVKVPTRAVSTDLNNASRLPAFKVGRRTESGVQSISSARRDPSSHTGMW